MNLKYSYEDILNHLSSSDENLLTLKRKYQDLDKKLIDEKMVPLINHLQFSPNFSTEFCCQGHEHISIYKNNNFHIIFRANKKGVLELFNLYENINTIRLERRKIAIQQHRFNEDSGFFTAPTFTTYRDSSHVSRIRIARLVLAKYVDNNLETELWQEAIDKTFGVNNND